MSLKRAAVIAGTNLALLVILGGTAQAQQEGQGAVWEGSTLTLTPTEAVVYASAFSGTDPCVSIQNAISTAIAWDSASISTIGLTVDARGFVDPGGTTNCSVNPFAYFVTNPSTIVAVKLLLGRMQFRTTATWVLPDRGRIEGDGGTVIQASSSVTTSVLKTVDMSALGTGGIPSAMFAIGLQDLTIDCNGNAAIGFKNQASQEETTLDRVAILNCTDTGLALESASAMNSGPYRDLQIIPNTGAATTTTCVRVGVPASGSTNCTGGANSSDCLVYGWRGIDGLTCDGTQASATLAVGLDISGEGGRISNAYIAGFTTGVRVGGNSNGTTNGLILENIRGCISTTCTGTAMNPLVKIVAASGASVGVTLAALEFTDTPTSSGPFIISDQAYGKCYWDQSVSLYAMDDISGTKTRQMTANQEIGSGCP